MMREVLTVILAVGLSLSVVACAPSEFASEDLGVGAHLGMPVSRVLSHLRKALPNLPVASFSCVGGTAAVQSPDDGFEISHSDLDRDGKVDLIVFSSTLYSRSEYARGLHKVPERFRTRFTEPEFAAFVDSFTAKYPQVKTQRGLTLGATSTEVRQTYGLVPPLAEHEGVKQLAGYRQGGNYLLFVLFGGRVVRIALLRRIWEMDYHLESIF